MSRMRLGNLNQYVAAISGSMGCTITGAAMGWPSPTLVKMANNEAPLSLHVSQVSLMVSLLFLGQITSPLLTAYLMDALGRKRTCICLSVFPFMSWLLILCASSAADLYIARFTAGLWLGVTATVVPVYVAEIAHPKLRSSLGTINNLSLNVGVLFTFLLGPYVSYATLAVACEALTVVYMCTFALMPETPHFFIKHGQRENACGVLGWLRSGESEEDITNEIKRIETALEDQNAPTMALKEIFSEVANRRAMVISITITVLRRMSGFGVMQAYASTTLPKRTLAVLDPDTCVIIIGFVSLFSSLISTVLSVKYRRRILMTISCGGCAITTATITAWFFLEYTSVDATGYSDVVFVSMALYYCAYNIGLGPVGTNIRGEIFSPRVRATAASLTSVVGALSGFLMNEFYLIIAGAVGMYVNYLIFFSASVGAIVFTWTWMPETHNRSLEDIQEVLRKGHKYSEKNKL